MFKKEIFISILTSVILFTIGCVIIDDNSNYMERSVDQLSNEIVQSQAVVLERSIKRSTSSAIILRNHIHTLNGDMNDFEEYADDLYTLLSGITNLQLAPNGIVTKIYPLKGHEKAIGHDIFKSDNRKKEAFLAKKSKKLTLAGPFNLVQGGVAIIARSPVYLHSEEVLKSGKKQLHKDATEFWGFASALVYLDDLIKTTDLLKLKEKDYLYRLWRHHPDTGKIDIFAGEKNLPQKKLFSRTINVPNGQWNLDIEYVGSSFSDAFVNIFYSLNVIISMILGYSLFIILNRPKELKREVDEKTKELKKLTNAVTYNNNAIFIANEIGKIEYINPAFEKMTGYTLANILKNEIDIFKDEIENTIKNQDNFTIQKAFKNKDNEKFVAIVTISIVKDSNFNIISYVGVCQDITQKIKNDELLHEKEILLLQQSKMASMGEMLENIAHQWRQPLSVISVSASGLKMQHELGILDDKRLIELVDGITDSSQYLSSTINDFRDFFKPNKDKTICNSNELIDKTLNILMGQFKNIKIELIKNIEDIDFKTYQNELLQVMVNILNNAKDQLSKIEKKDDRKNLILIDLFKKDDRIFIQIKDNGGGIPEDIIDKIFEPYFTTKDKYVGTGIGLYMSQEIVKKHMNGELIAKNIKFTHENIEYSGAQFTISIAFE